MNTTTKASLVATVLLLVIALIFSVQNMTELKSTRQALVDRDAELDRMTKQMGEQDQMMRDLAMQLRQPSAPAVAAPSPEVLQKISQIEAELSRTKAEMAAQEMEKEMLVNRVEEKEVIREKELTEMQRRIRDAASIGEVSEVEDAAGFAVITAGAKQGVEPGIQFAIRRDVFIVGRVEVASLTDGNKSIVDIVPNSVQPGLKIRPGDTVISYPF